MTTDETRIFHQEQLLNSFTDAICQVMADENISRATLANVLGTSQQHITQLLEGTHTMTLHRASEMAWAINKTIQVKLVDITKHGNTL